MKKSLHIVLACGLALAWFGCKSETDTKTEPDKPSAQAKTSSTAPAQFTLVKLKVPNMF